MLIHHLIQPVFNNQLCSNIHYTYPQNLIQFPRKCLWAFPNLCSLFLSDTKNIYLDNQSVLRNSLWSQNNFKIFLQDFPKTHSFFHCYYFENEGPNNLQYHIQLLIRGHLELQMLLICHRIFGNSLMKYCYFIMDGTLKPNQYMLC